MGFLSKMKNKLTGGGAKVTITAEATDTKSPIKLDVTAVIKEEPIDITQVYLWVKSVETINIPERELNNVDHSINIETVIYDKKEFQITGAETLNGNQTYNWTFEFELTDGDVRPSYSGNFARHEWFFQVGLDCKGNDPDSGWQLCEIS